VLDSATSINHIKDNPDDLKIALDSISHVLLKPGNALPQGYQPVVSMKNGKAEVHSEAITEEAKRKYPQRVKGKMRIKLPTGLSFREVLKRARISQTPIDIEMLDMQKMIGDMIDPYQDQFQEEWRNSTFKIIPEELPPGTKCRIGIENSPYQYETVMRMRPVNPDDNILVISNEEDHLDFVLILTYHTDTKAMDFTYRFSGKTWTSIYKFLHFMKTAVPGNTLYVRTAEKEQDLFKAKLDQVLFNDDYEEIDGNLEVAKRLIAIESQYGIQFPTESDISSDDIQMIYFLSDSINAIPLEFTWEKCRITGNLQQLPFQVLSKDMSLKYKEIANITILGKTIPDLNVCVAFESVRIENLEEVRAWIAEHKSEPIEVDLVPGNGGNRGTRMVEI
jgi:hypothetical protein